MNALLVKYGVVNKEEVSGEGTCRNDQARRGRSLEPPKPRHAKRLARDGGETSRSAYFWLKLPNIGTTNLSRGVISVSINYAVRPSPPCELFSARFCVVPSLLPALGARLRNCCFVQEASY